MGNNQSSNQTNNSFFSNQKETFKKLCGSYGKIYKVVSRLTKEDYRKECQERERWWNNLLESNSFHHYLLLFNILGKENLTH